MNYEFYGVAVAGLVIIWIMFWSLKRETKKQFDHQTRVNEVYYDGIRSELNILVLCMRDINERMAFLEAANIYTMPAEPSQPNPRSMAARKMHERRRQRKLEKKSE